MTVTRSPPPSRSSRFGEGRLLADQHAQHVRRHRIVPIAGAVADPLDRHRRDRAVGRSVGGGDQRAGRRHHLLLHLAAVDGRGAENLHRRRRRHRKHAVRGVHHPAADIQRRADDPVGAGPLHREHRADDVDDGVEGAHLVQVDLLHRHLMNRRLGFPEPLKHRLRLIAPFRRQRRAVDHREDLWQMTMRVRLRGRVQGSWFRVQGPLVDAELGRRDAGAENLLGAQFDIAERQAAQRALQVIERQAGVEQRAERHVARDPRKTVEVQNPAHGYSVSLMLQYRASPRIR